MKYGIIVTGAAGFISSHLVDHLLALGHNVVGIDNLKRGKLKNLENAKKHSGFIFVEQDLSDMPGYQDTIKNVLKQQPIQAVWHMAANSDIAAGVADASIDLRDTYMTTFNTLEIMRKFHIPILAFASSSAIYGNHSTELVEDTGPLLPISNYGAMKLASEGLISAAIESFLERAYIFRFPNVIGSRATHGVIYDLMHKLKGKPGQLDVLGDGNQQKPYLHVSELINAMRLIVEKSSEQLNYYNIGVSDEGVTVRSIAEMIVNVVAPGIPINYSGGQKGWIGDVPRFRYSIEKLAKLGWKPQLSSMQAVQRAVAEIWDEIKE